MRSGSAKLVAAALCVRAAIDTNQYSQRAADGRQRICYLINPQLQLQGQGLDVSVLSRGFMLCDQVLCSVKEALRSKASGSAQQQVVAQPCHHLVTTRMSVHGCLALSGMQTAIWAAVGLNH